MDDNDNDVPQGQEGEIILRGENVTSGYWHRPESSGLGRSPVPVFDNTCPTAAYLATGNRPAGLGVNQSLAISSATSMI